MSIPRFIQKRKYGKTAIRYLECEKPSEDMLVLEEKKGSGKSLVVGHKAISRFSDWLQEQL